MVSRGLVVIGAVSAVLLTACGGGGSNSSSSVQPSNGQSSSNRGSDVQTFAGNLDSAPVSRTVHLSAGEALRWWVRPSGDVSNDGDGGDVLAITTNDPALVPVQDSQQEDFSEFFSDYPNLDDEFGTPLVQTDYDDEAKFTVSYSTGDPVLFSDFGRGWGPGDAAGDWLTFVAPETADYQLLVGGTGPFTGAIQTNPPPSSAASSSNNFGDPSGSPFTPDQWSQVVSAQIDFLYSAEGFYPNDGFFSDYSDAYNGEANVDFGPKTHLATVQQVLRQGHGN